jgi:acetyl esterase/lipase
MASQVQSVLRILPSFEIHQETYKTVRDQPIGVHVLIPKHAQAGKRPVLVKLHGGAFVEGTSDDWWRPW